MIRSFLNTFENLLSRKAAGSTPKFKNVRTHAAAIVPNASVTTVVTTERSTLHGTILTGEMFAPILTEQIERYNEVSGSRLYVVGVPNTYFGGDVSVAGLLSGKDYINIKNQVKGDFVIIPKHTIKSDEPILIDGMTFEDLKRQYPVPIYDLDLDGLMDFLGQR
jgi:NifB/MoaA-like Fe-S oxidoreductase